ncbi:MAG TPA: hypothetical protein VN039_04665 [Nitrospira sp.]|jgi:hypothetical protein|nr:hypothetical protein [Nitrospira sp.]
MNETLPEPEKNYAEGMTITAMWDELNDMGVDGNLIVKYWAVGNISDLYNRVIQEALNHA